MAVAGGVSVSVGVAVGVSVAVGLGVAVSVAAGDGVGVGVAVSVGVGVIVGAASHTRLVVVRARPLHARVVWPLARASQPVGSPPSGKVTPDPRISQYVKLSDVRATLDRLHPALTWTLPSSVTGAGVGVLVGMIGVLVGVGGLGVLVGP